MNALNSILSYVQRPTAINTLEGLGIQVFADAAKTQFRNVMEIFQDVAAKWPTLSAAVQDGFVKAADDAGLYNEELAQAIGTQQEWNDLQQRDISQAAAGVYRRNYFIGMIERLSKAQEVLNGMTDAAGYSQTENARTMDTLEKKYQSLQAAAQQLAVSLGDSGLTEILKGLANAGTFVLQTFEKLPKPVQDGVLAFTAMFTVLKTGEYALKMFGVTAGTTAAATAATAGAMGAVNTAAQSSIILDQYGNAMRSVTMATNEATTASKGFMAANKWLLIISVAVSAISMIVGAISRYREEQRRLVETTKQNIESLTEEKQGLQELSKEYETLKSKQDTLTATADEKKRLLEVQKELVSQYGVSITGIDAEGQAYADSIELIKLRTKALEDELAVEQARLETAVKAKDATDVEDLENNLQKRIQLSSQLSAKQKEINNYESILLNKGQYQGSYNGRLFTVDANTEYGANILRQYVQNASREQLAIQSNLDKVNLAIQNGTADRQKLLQNDATTTIKQLEENGTKITDSARAFASEFAKSLALEPKDIYAQRDALKGFIDQLNSSDFDELIEKYDKFKSEGDTKGMDATSKAIVQLAYSLATVKNEVTGGSGIKEGLKDALLTIESTFVGGLKKATQNTYDFQAAIQRTQDNLSTLSDEVATYDEILSKAKSGQEVYIDDILKWQETFPQILNYLEVENGIIKVQEDAVKALMKAKQDEAIAFEIAEKAKLETTKTAILQRLEYYNLEAEILTKSAEDVKTATEKAYKEKARALGVNPNNPQQLSELRELQDTVNNYRDTQIAIDNAIALIQSGKFSGGGSSTSKSKTNEALQNALKLLEHTKSMAEESQESIKKEIAELNRINSLYAKTADERMDMAEKIYNAEKRLMDRRLQDSVNWINEKKSLDQLSADEEIAAWERVLKNQSDNIEAVKEATVNLYKLRKQASQDAYDSEENSIQHWAKLGIYSIQQQIDAYQELYSVKAESIADEYKRTENLFDLYKDLLSEQQKAIKAAYDERLDLIDAEAEAKKKARQEEIKAIDEELKRLDRQENIRDYEQEMAKLKKDLAYWSVRTSVEADQKKADLTKEIAEKEHDREVELKKQSLNDKKDILEDEIDDIEETAKAEKEKWEKSYKLVEKAFDTHSINIIAAAGAMAEGAYQEWVNKYLIPLQNALKSGDLDDFETGSGKLEGSTGSMSTNAKIYQAASSILELKRQYEVGGDKSAAQRAVQYYNELEKLKGSVADDLHKLNYQQAIDYVNKLPKAHGGGETLSYGAVYMKPGELIYPPTLSADLKTLMSMIQGFSTRPIQQLQSVANSTDRRVIFNAPLFHSDKTVFEDDVDERSFSRELQRAVQSIPY